MRSRYSIVLSCVVVVANWHRLQRKTGRIRMKNDINSWQEEVLKLLVGDSVSSFTGVMLEQWGE